MLQTALALGAGIATIASPCVLPMLPILLGATVARSGSASGRYRPLFIALGFVLSFSGAAWLFGASTRALGLSPDALRTASIVVLALSGLLLIWPTLLERAMAPLGGLANLAQRLGDRAGTGYVGGLLIGLSLGLLWTPCAGPVLASILALVATEQQPRQAAALLLAYAVGAGLPMLLIAYGGQAVTARVRGLSRHAGVLRRVFGLGVIATALAMHWQVDAAASAWLSRAISAAPTESAGTSANIEATQAPEFTGIDTWLNTAPLTLAQLRGKVVLVDFWTYSCVNCLNTLPQLKRWHAQYRDQGLVVVGVHTPEFGFERDTGNVRAAIQRLGIDYAVAQDNRYKTWTAWHNQYWPGLYLVNREGRIVFQHAGEGDYAQIEQQIQAALR
ncbi:cytochrome c biogenesis protein DipZ [Xylophilus sp. GW821-FHT01B05]